MLVFDGLHFFGQRSICRLRVAAFNHDSPRVVIATHLHDAPGASITNDFEALVRSVGADFGSVLTRWILHYPPCDDASVAEDASWTEATVTGEEPGWRRISREEAETISGLDLSLADTEPATIVALAGDRGVLGSLAEVPEPDRVPGEYLRAVPIAAVPFPHAPFRCPHQQRFSELARLYGDADRTVVGAHWFLTLTEEDFGRCPFHANDWLKVAEGSVAILESLGPDATGDDVTAACAERSLPQTEARWLFSLFADPIVWTPHSSELTNGQHRVCAIRASGASHCVVDTDGFPPPRTSAASPRAAASAALASYWAVTAAKG